MKNILNMIFGKDANIIAVISFQLLICIILTYFPLIFGFVLIFMSILFVYYFIKLSLEYFNIIEGD